MACLWVRDRGEWTAVPLDRDPVELGVEPARAILVSKIEGDKTFWTLVVSPEEIVRVNGDRVMLGIRVMRDRDAIQVGGGARMFFSSESAPTVVSYSGAASVNCARCNTEIRPGDLAVRCPACRVFLHQTAELGCWAYGEACVCGHPTSLNAENCWRPDGI